MKDSLLHHRQFGEKRVVFHIKEPDHTTPFKEGAQRFDQAKEKSPTPDAVDGQNKAKVDAKAISGKLPDSQREQVAKDTGMTPEEVSKTEAKLVDAAKDGIKGGEFAEIIKNLIEAIGSAIEQLFVGIEGFDTSGSSSAAGSGAYGSPEYSGASGSSEMSMESTLATINDPETKNAVQEFCEKYGRSGHLSKDFRNSEYINFEGKARCMVNNEVLPDFANLAITYYKKTGKPITITSAYRDIDHQRDLQGGKNPAAKPGNSNHNTGHAIDFGQDVVTGFSGFGTLARACNFTGISSENWHFDHKSKKPAGQTRMAYAQKINSSVA